MILTLTWIIFWLPFLMAILLGYGLPKSSKLAGVLGTAAMFTAFLLSCALLPQYDALKHQGQTLLESSLPWIHVGNLTLDFGIYVNGLTLLMLLVVTGIGTLVFLFSTSYMAGDPGYNRYFACLSLFSFSMLGIVLANNLIQIFIFWELVGLSSYLLIGFWYEKTEASTAGKKAFMTTRVGDVGMMLGILGLYGFMASKGVESFNFTVIASHLSSLGISSFWMTLITLGLFLGAVGKSAQVPLHVWLPDAMEGPTPVSALIHAATMVAAGIFMVVRLYFIFEVSPETLRIIAWTGGITAFLAATLALVQTDIKKVLAYSTLSQLGYMVLALGLASPEAGMFHLTTHAFFKALLFLGAGSLIHALHTQDIREMAGMAAEEAVGGQFTGCVSVLPDISKPVIVAVRGVAAGGGCELVEMCDIVIAAFTAKFLHPEITLAAMPGAGGTQRLSRVVGKHLAMDLLLTGRSLSAEEALVAGLASRVVPDDQLDEVALAVAKQVASFSGPVTRRIKASVNDTQVGLADGLMAERNRFHACFSEHDFREGLGAFMDRRSANFLHR